MTTPTATPWSATPALLWHKDGTWQQVDEKTLAGEHASAALMYVLGRVAGLRPPFGRSLFADVLQRTPGTLLTGDEIRSHDREDYDSGARTLESAERVLASSLSRHGARGTVRSALPVDHMIIRYLSDITAQQPESPQPRRQSSTAVVDARGVRDLIGATDGELRKAADKETPHAFLQWPATRGTSQSAPPLVTTATASGPGEARPGAPEPDLDPQWLTADAIWMIDVARMVSLASWKEALKNLPARVGQLLWTAAEDPASSTFAPYRPAHDPEVLAAFAQVPARHRAISLPSGLRTQDAALCQRYGRDPVDDHAAARLQAVREASQAWQEWEKELAEGSLASRGLIDTDGMRRIGADPLLRQKHALSIKRTVETERWLTSWLDAGGSLKE